MNQAAIGVVRQALHSSLTEKGMALLLDELPEIAPGATLRLDEGVKPEDLWTAGSLHPGITAAVVSKPRTARDLFRVLSLVNRFVTERHGAIYILPYTTEAGPENRFEATEMFLGVHPNWTRELLTANVVRLRKTTDALDVRQILDMPITGATLSNRQILDMCQQPERRVISLSVFGPDPNYWQYLPAFLPNYWQYLPAFIRAHHVLFHGWRLWIHHDDAIDVIPYGRVLRALEKRGLLKLVRMAPDGIAIGKCRAMLWRLAPAWDTAVDYVFSRDLDALPTWRERCAVEEFIASDAKLHTIHDAAAHCGILGGLCGVSAPALRALYSSFEEFVDAAGFSAERWTQHGADQDYLNSALLPRLRSFGHSLRVHGHNRQGAMGSIPFVTEIAAPPELIVLSVPREIQERSNQLSAYMGVAGYDWRAAVAYYNKLPGDTINAIQDAEREIDVL